uniref:Uncharacterized protein n=1 Tax=Sander lucioperca TaxID=283035 RepID=A0A8C9YI24_SANLU
MEKSKNFRVDALLADETNLVSRDRSPVLSSDSPAGSPLSCRCTDTLSPRAAQLQRIIHKPGVLNLPHPGLASIPGMYHAPMYPLSALRGKHPAFAYIGFTQLTQTYPEHLKAVAMAGSLPLEHWIRASIMMPRLPDYSSRLIIVIHVHFCIKLQYRPNPTLPNPSYRSESDFETIVDTAGRGGLINLCFHGVDVELSSS